MTKRESGQSLIELRTQIASVTEEGHTATQELVAALHEQIPVVENYCHSLLPDSAQADQAVEETIRRALRQLPDFDGGGSLTGWLVRIARSVCSEQSPLPGFVAYTQDGLVGSASSSEALEDMSDRERAALVTRAAKALGPEPHQFAHLRYQRGLPLEKAAEILRIPSASEWLADIQERFNRAIDDVVASLTSSMHEGSHA